MEDYDENFVRQFSSRVIYIGKLIFSNRENRFEKVLELNRSHWLILFLFQE